MCIIIAKKSGIEMPDKRTLEICHNNNPDGSGFMYRKGGRVIISKGYRTTESLIAGLASHKIGSKDNLIIHFRWATHGETNEENCHPFPLSKKLKHLKSIDHETDIGMAHNGVIPIEPTITGISDTMEFAFRLLSQTTFREGIRDKTVSIFKAITYLAPSNRFAFLTKKDFITLGEGWCNDKLGIEYSNDGYKKEKIRFSGHYSGYYGCDGGYDDEMWASKDCDYCGAMVMAQSLTHIGDDMEVCKACLQAYKPWHFADDEHYELWEDCAWCTDSTLVKKMWRIQGAETYKVCSICYQAGILGTDLEQRAEYLDKKEGSNG